MTFGDALREHNLVDKTSLMPLNMEKGCAVEVSTKARIKRGANENDIGATADPKSCLLKLCCTSEGCKSSELRKS